MSSRICYTLEKFTDPIPDQSMFEYKKSKKLKEIQLELKEIFTMFNKLIRKYRLSYCLDSGTLLGAVRHGNIIPWDDDIDVSMTKEDIAILRKHKPDLNKIGYTLTYNDKIYRFKKLPKKNEKVPYIDIFEVHEKDRKIEYANEKNKRVWEDYWFKPSEKYPLKVYKFGRLNVLGPNNPYPYLKRAYGDWNEGEVWEAHHNI